MGRPRFTVGWVLATLALAAAIYAVSIRLFPDWTENASKQAQLAGASVVAAIGIMVGLRALLKPPEQASQSVAQAQIVITPAAPALPPSLPSTLHQIPAPPADFTGREAELEELLDAAGADGVTISGLRGLGGVGKTALAFKVAEGLAPRYPDAQLFLDLKGTSGEPLTPAEAMKKVIAAFHPEAKLGESEADLRPLYLSALHGKRALLLLDNARDKEQVEPLLPPSGCFVLVTSRWTFHLPGLRLTDLDVLPPDKARALAVKIAARLGDSPSPPSPPPLGEGGSAADALARVCGCLPLALRVAASTLAERPGLPVGEYLRRFEDAQQRLSLTGVQASLELSYALLPDDLKERFVLLSVFPAPFDRAAAAAVWDMNSPTAGVTPPAPASGAGVSGGAAKGLASGRGAGRIIGEFLRRFAPQKDRRKAVFDEAAAQDVLDELVRFSLLDLAPSLAKSPSALESPSPGGRGALAGSGERGEGESPTRYRLHDLVRDFAATRGQGDAATEGPRSAAEGMQRLYRAAYRHAAYYCEVARAAKERYKEGGDGVLAGLALFDREWEHIRAGQAWAAARADADEDAARLCVYYPDAGLYCLDLRLHPREQIRWREAALGAARRLGMKSAEGAHLGNLGLAYADLGEPRRAIEYYEQDLAIAHEIGDRQGEGGALNNLGNAYRNLGDLPRAIELFEQSLQNARDIGYRPGEGNALGNLGLAYADMGNPHRAIEYYERGLLILRETGNRRGEGQTLNNLGLAYADLGHLGRAIEYYGQQLAITREIGDRRGEGQALGNLGLSNRQLGQPRQAIEYFEQVLRIMVEIGDRNGEGLTLSNLGIAYKNLGDPRRAIELYEQHLQIARETGDRRGEGSALMNLGNAYADLGEPRRAIEYYEQSLTRAQETSDRRGEGNALGNLGNAYLTLGEPRRAIEYHEQCLAITREIGDRQGEAIASWNLGYAYETLGDLPRAIELMQVRVHYEREIGHPDAEKHAARVEEMRQRMHDE